MHQCPKCGFSPKESPRDAELAQGGDDDDRAIDEVLAELDDVFGEGLAGALKGSKKPKAVDIEIEAAGPRDDDEDEELG